VTRAAGLLLVGALLGAPAARGENLEVLSKGGITITFEHSGDKQQIDAFRRAIVPEVEAILASLVAELGVPAAPAQARLSFFSPETFHSKFPQTIDTQIPAFFDGNVVNARADNDVNFALKRTLRHELTHLLLHKNVGRIPSWLHEGLAVYMERMITSDTRPNEIDYNTLHVAKQDGIYIPLEKLEAQHTFNRSEGVGTSRLAYTIGYVATYELIQRYGMDSMRKFLAAAGMGRPTASAFVDTFGLAMDKFDAVLLEAAAKRS
jgi:hypothetical protein